MRFDPGALLASECSDCGQTVNAKKGEPAPHHRRKGEFKGCDGTGEPTK